MPTHHNLDHYLKEYIAAAGIALDRKGPLFRISKDAVVSWPTDPCCNRMRGG
jgi:hypothetical protein